SIGVSVFLLKYRVPARAPKIGLPKWWAALQDAQRAVSLVRSGAVNGKWGNAVNASRIGFSGFSAGGHLASTVATHFDRGNPTADDPIERISSRPNFAVLVYPVVTMHHPTHRGSRRNLLGDHPTPALLDLYSNEKQVTSETPPIFLAHAIDDRPVPIENSRLLFRALRANGISAKLLELKSGGHGLNGYQGASWDQWQEQSLDWMLKLRR
ncbi:MAG: alpha/beta hydrolase, partial [Rubripirellula sp.]